MIVGAGTGAIRIGGNVLGGAGAPSAYIQCGTIASITIGGSLLAGSGNNSARIVTDGDMGAVTIGGYEGQLLDLRLAPSWTKACLGPEGPIAGSLILKSAGAGPGPLVGLSPDVPVRLILLDLGNGRTMAVTGIAWFHLPT